MKRQAMMVGLWHLIKTRNNSANHLYESPTARNLSNLHKSNKILIQHASAMFLFVRDNRNKGKICFHLFNLCFFKWNHPKYFLIVTHSVSVGLEIREPETYP